MKSRSEPVLHVVDDDAAVRESLEAVLVVSGFDVVTHDSAERFLAQARGDRGCVILDINMPGMGGLELLERLTREEPGAAVVVLTATRDARIQERARELGAGKVLAKPVTREDLLDAIAEVRGASTWKPLL